MDLPLAYIIMPVGSDANFEAKRSVLEASAGILDWAMHFPLDPNVSQSDLHKETNQFDLSATLEEMRTATLIVADLSLERPSCYYELGLAQALGRPALLLAAEGTRIHQLADRDQVSFYADLQELGVLVTAALNDRAQ